VLTERGREERSTTGRLIRRYHTLNGRPSLSDNRVCRNVFRSFERSLGGWLPAERSTPILDAACGEGALLCWLRGQGYTDLAGCDLSSENAAICRESGLECVFEADVLELGRLAGARRFGAIFALDILEHLPKQRAAGFLEDLRGLLLPGGYLVLQTPNLGSHLGWLHYYGDLTHEFGLTESSALSLLRAAGFSDGRIRLRPAWSAATAAGRVREAYTAILHRLLWIAEGAARPRIASRNLLIRAEAP
jgi:2-polyprenyl-3-methyl-5-hydroxy-6-metoxy-1,4-benzoquinol methylase